jgi:TetR/AcrR family transcriptional repressor of nem operon
VGLKPASIDHHIPTNADLAAAAAKRNWEDFAAGLAGLSAETSDPIRGLRQYLHTFRKADGFCTQEP